jgi:hypothetical protein
MVALPQTRSKMSTARAQVLPRLLLRAALGARCTRWSALTHPRACCLMRPILIFINKCMENLDCRGALPWRNHEVTVHE